MLAFVLFFPVQPLFPADVDLAIGLCLPAGFLLSARVARFRKLFLGVLGVWFKVRLVHLFLALAAGPFWIDWKFHFFVSFCRARRSWLGPFA